MKRSLLALFFCVFASLQGAESHRVVILGGGIGGLTSALYAARAGQNPLIIEGSVPGGAIMQSHNVQNWPGEVDISGWDLMEKVRKQVELSGAKFLSDEVVGVDFSQKPFLITTRSLDDPEKTHIIRAQSCVIALGSSPKFLGVPGETNYWLQGIYNCAVCDGALFKNKTVAVVGGGDGAISEAHYLSQIAKKVYVIVRKNDFRTVEEHRKREVLLRPNVEVIYNTTVQEIKGNGEMISHLLLKNEIESRNKELPVDGLFLAIGSTPNTHLFQGQLELDPLGYIVLKGDVQTSIPGVFAIGDIADPIYRQAISAAADGMKAAGQVDKYLASQTATFNSLESQGFSKRTSLEAYIEIQDEEQFDREIKAGNCPTVVDFYATWCPPCKAVNPHFVSTAKNMAGKINFLKVNTDQFPRLNQRFHISSMPTLLTFDRQGKLLGKQIGSKHIIDYLRALDRLQESTAAQIDKFLQKKGELK